MTGPANPSLALVNARLLDPASGLDAMGGLICRDGMIAALGPNVTAASVSDDMDIVDCGGRCLAPGLIDSRAQLGEPGAEHKETFVTASAAAAAGGITSIICLPNTDPVIDDVSQVEFIARRVREVGQARIYTYAALTKGLGGAELCEMGTLAEAGVVAFTDGDRALADALVMRRALDYAATFGLLVVQHPEEPSLVRGGQMNEGELATRLGLAPIPGAAEIIMIERDLRLVELTGGRIHFAHISTGAGVEAIRAAKARGLNVTCDTAPAYFSLNESAVGDYRTFAKLSPPLRGEADRAAIAAAVADGTIDVVASDHTPQDQDSKRLPFAQAAPGIVGLETLLPLTLTLYHDGRMSLLEALRPLTVRPAEIFGLPGGRMAEGLRADLVLFDPDRPRRLDPDAFLSKSKNAPFEGHPVQGEIARTMVSGRTLFTNEPPAGASKPAGAAPLSGSAPGRAPAA